MYWAADTQDKIFNGVSEEDLEDLYGNYLDNSEDENPLSFEEFKINYGSSLDRILLDLEKQILLHPRNAHQLLMPLTDEIFVKDIYDDLKQEGLIKEPSKSFTGAILPSTNVKNTTIFVKGKYGVGPVALGITNSSTNQADELSINDTFINNDGVRVPTKLLFKYMGDVYALDNYTDNKGTVISEILSQLLTTQVDNVKNPTAVLMNINMQTLGVMLYLIRRKINPKSIVLFLQQPIIAKYLQYQRQNESLFNKQADTELSKKELLWKLKEDLGYKYARTDLPDVYEVKEGQSQFEISDREMLAKAKSGKFDENQLNYLAYFIQLQSQARSFSDFQQTQNSDTKGLKDKQMLDEANVVFARAEFSEIIKPIDFDRLNTNGVIAPFYNFGRRRYSIYNRFFALAQSRFGNALFEFKNKAAAIASSANKDRVRQTIENDFMLFLVHKYVLNKSEFDRLTKGDSVAKRVRELKTKLPSNLVLKAFFPMLANTVDRIDDRKIDNLRLFEKELNSLDSNDLRLSLEEIADTDIDLYNDIVKLLMFQSGLNISPFNYRSVIPVGLNSVRNEFNDYEYLYQDILKEAITKMNADRSLDHEKEFKTFVTLFSANNPQFLKKHSQYLFTDKYPYPLAKVYDRGSKSTILRPAKGNESQPQLGDAYHKQYFEELINSNLFNTKPKQSEQKEILNAVFNDDIPVTPYEEVKDVPISESLDKYELFPGVFANKGQTEALDKLREFLNSGDREFTLIGRGGTGKTTIIKKILGDIKEQGKSVLGITVAHKAKKVLGRSIGKNKVKTVASSLAIKLDESTGKFTPDIFARANDRVPIKYADIIIVDEASMISPAIYQEILDLSSAGAKVIFMGDNAQLPPVGEQVDSPVFSIKNQYTLLEKMRQAKTSPIINVGTMVADNIESKSPKLVAITNRVNSVDPISKSQTVFISDESVAIDNIVKDIEKANENPDFVKAVTFNNEKHNSPQSVKNLNDKIRLKLLKEKSKNQFNIGEMVTAYDSYSKDPSAEEIHNSDDFVIKSIEKSKATDLVKVFSRAKGERTFRLNYETLILELMDSEGEIYFAPVIADASKQQFEKDLQELWKTDTQLGFAVKGSFANIQYGYAITSHKAQGSTYTNTYVFEDNILGSSNAGDIVTKNKSLYVAVSRPTTKLVMISSRNENSKDDSPVTQDDIDNAILLFELDQSTSMYSPSLKMYENFVQTNQLYVGDEILPLIGESEYYRYLVPMLLKMNPKASTVITDDMKFVLQNIASKADMEVIENMNRIPSGISSKILNRNFINSEAKVKTLVHELVHLTLQKEYEKNGDFKTKIDELYSLTSDFDSVDAYGFTNPKEFLAEALSSPEFMEILNNLPYKGQTMWTYLMTLISDFINNLLSVELKSDSVLAEVVRASEQVLNKNLSEVSKEKKVSLSEFQKEIVENWDSYFPDYSWMNSAQREMTAKLAEEGKIQLNCSI